MKKHECRVKDLGMNRSHLLFNLNCC